MIWARCACMAVLMLLAFSGPAFAQIDMMGKLCFPLGPGTDRYEPGLKNLFRVPISDFKIKLVGPVCPDIDEVLITGLVGVGDWDVDDDLDGNSNEPLPGGGTTEFGDNNDGNTSTKEARVDKKGSGNEGPPQNAPGMSIGVGDIFRVSVIFGQATPANVNCELCIWATDDKNFQLALADINPGNNLLAADHDGMIPTRKGLGISAVNQTAKVVNFIQIVQPNGLSFGNVTETDPHTSAVLSERNCSSPQCGFKLTRPVAPGESLWLDVGFTQLAPGAETTFNLTGDIDVPALGAWGIVVLVGALLVSGWYLSARTKVGRRPPSGAEGTS